MTLKLSKDVKLAEEQQKHKRHCQHCGHTITFYAYEPKKKLCSWCGLYTYKDKQSEFEIKLLNFLNKSKKSC